MQRSYWAVAYRQAGHPTPLLRVSAIHRQYKEGKARHVNPIGQTETRTTKGHSAQVRNLHVNNRRLWCNFSEVPGELLMGPGQVVRSYDLPSLPHTSVPSVRLCRPKVAASSQVHRPSQPQRSRFEIRLSFPFRVSVCLASSLGPRHQD